MCTLSQSLLVIKIRLLLLDVLYLLEQVCHRNWKIWKMKTVIELEKNGESHGILCSAMECYPLILPNLCCFPDIERLSAEKMNTCLFLQNVANELFK